LSSTEPQVSWKVIDAGAAVVSSDGEKAGSVSRVVGDPEADVFTGLAVSVGFLSGDRFVPSERVQGIWPDRIEVGLTKSELESLPEYKDAPVVKFEPEKPSLWDRLFGRR
jgi:hypothetical protein